MEVVHFICKPLEFRKRKSTSVKYDLHGHPDLPLESRSSQPCDSVLSIHIQLWFSRFSDPEVSDSMLVGIFLGIKKL